MSWESPQFRTTSLTLLATGIVVLLLSIALAYSAQSASLAETSQPSSSVQLAYLIPTLLGGLLTFIAGIRVSLFARPWNLVLGGVILVLASWFAPAAISTIPQLKGLTWTGPTLLALLLFRILGLIFSTTGALRLLRKQPVGD